MSHNGERSGMLMTCLLVAAGLAATVEAQFQYCRFTPKHTLCQHRGPGPRCDQMQARGVTAREAKYIVAEHNELRDKVASGRETRGSIYSQPQAANMRQLEWDEELAKVAQRHAEQCVFKHDCRDCKRVARFKVGQNLYSSSSTRLDNFSEWRRAIYAWYDEVALFNPEHIEPFVFSSPLGHYTQLAWATSSRIGCGYALYKEGPWWTKLYVCNYGSAGNFQRGQMYERGTPCSQCPSGTSCSRQYPALCSDGSGGSPIVSTKQPALPATPAVDLSSLPNADGRSLFSCDLDHEGCRVKFIGTTWKVINTDSAQGRILGTAVTSGRTTELTFQSLVLPPREGSLCLHYSFLKYELRGSAAVELVFTLEPMVKSGHRPIEHVERSHARGAMTRRSVQLDHVTEPFRLRVSASVPAWAFGQATVVAVDDVRLVAGPC
ncbi:CRISP/Allergen/PR-1 [Amphibalanus amphitrite]|uniref:CRISP/Allergen/PR-1 n=2 Tax=Amphibalanus amphitrite TaxID=1232801 RepID=A0A6A4XFK6_AMPAM|nr:CRISP/Allergen/PR-1 [Amphibalanus amphitrite]